MGIFNLGFMNSLWTTRCSRQSTWTTLRITVVREKAHNKAIKVNKQTALVKEKKLGK